ncbi:MAG TPA: gamma-glutamyl-gamma-aminobutyrate hydrolase family protein [Solirubrobacteraceae bacterium]
MRPVALITHLPDRDAGLIRECLAAEGCPVLECNPLDGTELPGLADVSGIVSLGGRESATELDRYPFLVAEVALMKDALEHGVPVLGMCLGAQLLALAAGGRVSRIGTVYAGWAELSMTSDGRADPVFGELSDRLRVLKWHEDEIELPRLATVLGDTSSPGIALFRVGPAAWGSQMHLEVTPGMLVDGWLSEDVGVSEIEAAGHEIDQFRAESIATLPAQMAESRPVFSRFAELVRGVGLARPGAAGAARLPRAEAVS